MTTATQPDPAVQPGAAPEAAAPASAAGRPLDGRTPLMLLPMRLETRFADTATGVSFLLLRVYPDTISVSSFEPELTQDEVNAGRAYWDLIWHAGNPPQDQDAVQGPWRVLAGAYTPQRAAWIALQLTPANLAQMPAAPTPADQAPSPAPVYPAPPMRDSSYEQAPTAQALPSAWTAALTSGSVTRQVTGSPITPGLAVGLTPHDGTFPDGLPVDADMRWLADFDEAVSAGMGLRIRLTPEERAGGFDRIVVFGLCDGKDDEPGNAGLAALLDAHHYTDGLAFVPQGAPTNNTPDASSAYTRKDPDYAISFAVERGAPLTSVPDADGPVAAALLGIPAATFGHVQHADGHGVRNGRDMLTALWPATLGYFMEQLLTPVFGTGAIDKARTFALASAVPRGALPALRVGSTPYGILPVTPLPEAAEVAQTPAATLAGLLTRLVPAWQASVAAAPHIGATSDPDQDLAQVLGMDASSVDFRARQVIGDDAMWNLLQFLRFAEINEWWPEHLARGRELLDQLGLSSWDPRVIHTSMGRESYPVPYPTVLDGALSETAPLPADAAIQADGEADGQSVNYIQWLCAASVAEIQQESYPGPLPSALLYRILRQSVLRCYAGLAARAQVSTGTLAASALREPELVHVSQSAPTVTPWDIVYRRVAPGSAQTWAEYLHDLQPTTGSPFGPLADLRASLYRLATLPTAELDRLLSETLDACSHRIDVWLSAVAYAVLSGQRATATADSPASLHLGGYGWLENVRPAVRPPVVTGADAKAVAQLDESRRRLMPEPVLAALPPVLQPTADNGGFIHAPSMTQAAAGAVLRSGFMSHGGTQDEPVLAIDLSSDRTRLALWLLDGVRQGQALGALTGYRFEQALHDAGLDVYVQPFRDKYPLIAAELTAQTAAGQVVPPSQVVDGVALRAGWQAGDLAAGAYWGAELPLPSPPLNETQNTVLGFIGDIDDMLGALGDLSIAESVFQIMRGNFGRAGGILAAVSAGSQPPEPDIVATPVGGTDVTHRLMLLFAGPPADALAWAGIGATPRQLAEPWLSSWLGSRLPDPDHVRAIVSWTEGGQPQSATVTLSDLGTGPLDVLALAGASTQSQLTQPQLTQPQLSELESRIVCAAAPPADAAGITIGYALGGQPPGTIGFPDLLTVAQALRDMLGAARALTPQDFSPPETDAATGGTTDLHDLNERGQVLVGRLGADVSGLRSAITNIATAPQAVRDALIAASRYGIAGSVPQPSETADSLATRASDTLDTLLQRQVTATGLPLPAADPAGALAVITAVLPNAIVLPHVTPTDSASVQSAFGQSAAMKAVDPQALDRWLLQLSHIRPAVERFDLAMTATGLLGAPETAELTLGQLPKVAGDRWLGLPTDPGSPPVTGRVAVEALAVGDPATQTPLAGMLLDEWLDRIPAPTTSAGVAFHYDEPTARAPQALLLAVCPDERAMWNPALVEAILAQALELAKMRPVDLASIQQVGQVLPGLYFPFNLQAATIATTFLQQEVAVDITATDAG
jgi:hypothetical protein